MVSWHFCAYRDPPGAGTGICRVIIAFLVAQMKIPAFVPTPGGWVPRFAARTVSTGDRHSK
jgi:hypothetical protein